MNIKPTICIFIGFILMPALLLGAENMPAYSRGTLNLVMGDPDCLVIATDSRATIMHRNGNISAEDNHQKLFVVPNNIIITIAGYGSADVPTAPEFTAPSAGIILDYIEELKNNNRIPSYDEVISTLQHLLTFNLTSVGNINAWSYGSIKPGNYELQMLITGRKNSDFAVTKVILKLTLEGNEKNGYYVASNTHNISEKIVKEFTYETAGMDDIAVSMLKKTAHENKKILRNELKSIAESIMTETAKAHKEVGGPTQFVFLSKDKIDVSSPVFNRPKGPKIKHSLFIGGGFHNGKIAVLSNSPFLFISTAFDNTGVILDKNYFFGCQFKDCKIFLSSNSYNVHPSNKINNCKLYLEKNVDLESEKFKMLFKRFNKGDVYLKK